LSTQTADFEAVTSRVANLLTRSISLPAAANHIPTTLTNDAVHREQSLQALVHPTLPIAVTLELPT